MQKNHRLSLALALVLGSSEALALGLGSIRVSSSLNEPLVAEIPIVSSLPGETDGLKIRLASAEAFARAGIDRSALLPVNLDFSIARDAAGQQVVRVTTPNRMGEPILNFILEVEWARGRMLREYTVLLDPPRVAPARTAPAVAAPVREAAPAAAEILPPPAPRPAARPAPVASPPARPTPAPAAAPSPAPSPAPAAAPALSADRYGPVSAGETLWSIAQRVRPEDSSATINQTMLALLRANPDAFIGENINRLKRGAVLRIPTRDELSALSAAAAAAQVSEQARAWRDAPAAVSQPAEPVRAVESTPAAAVATPTRPSRLELLPPGGDTPASGAQSGSSTTGEGTELRAELSRAREEVATLQEENRDLRSRVTDLERLDSDTRRLLDLKDSQLAEAQQRLAELEAARTAAESAATAAPAEPAVDALASTPADAPVADVAVGDDSAESVDAAEEIAATGDPASTPVGGTAPAVQPVPEPTAAVAQPLPAATSDTPAAKPWYLGTPVIAGTLGAIIAILVAGMLSRRRRAQPSAGPRPSVADAYEAAAGGAVGAAAARDDEEQVEDGDYAELDRLLDEVAESPNDLGRHLALVGHYYRQGDASGFEGAAEAMYAQLYDTSHPSWGQVVAMGRDLLPDHPLFVDAPVAPENDFDLPIEPEAPAPASAATLDDDEWGSAPAAPAAATTQNFSVEEIDRLRAAASGESPFNTQQFPSTEYATGESDRVAAVDREPDPDADEAAATKLELARAYLDMGDVEGARGMLEEVVGEGNPGQRAEARRLLDEIR